MATRPVYVPFLRTPYYKELYYEFTYNSGFAVSQKQRNIDALHAAYKEAYPDGEVLEISSKSMQEGGKELSAFNLKKTVESLGRKVSVECIYQASKVFENGGPYTDLLNGTSKEAKKDKRLQTSGKLIGFRFEGKDFPIEPKTAFYNYIYINALLENEDLAKIVLEYDGFTDIEFNPKKGENCQAKAAAAYCTLVREGKIDQVQNFEDYLKLVRPDKTDHQPVIKPKKETNEETVTELEPGMKIVHEIYGTGTVLKVSNDIAEIEFLNEGIKKLSGKWCLKNCRIEP